jgi:hypothetical protein
MVETTLIYDSKEVTVRARLNKYRGGSPILVLEIIQTTNIPGHGGKIHIQGDPKDMRKFFNVIARVLRSPKDYTDGVKPK